MAPRVLRTFALALAAGAGCSSDTTTPSSTAPTVQSSAPTTPTATITFTAYELPFRYERGESGRAWPVETTGGGVGILDFDGDGKLDLFFAQGVPLPVGTASNPPADVVLRNLGDCRFEDVSDELGLTSRGYGQGVTVADYDADGDPDVYVTRYGGNTLWRNDAGKRFTDVTKETNAGGPGLWSLGAAFLDYDNDGDLDLFLVHYFAFDPSQAPFERDPMTGEALYGMPSRFEGQPDVLLRNDGGRFVDVTDRAGIAGIGRGMGVLAADFDRDGKIDVLVANDAMANALWRNKGDGTFEEVAETWGLALNGQGAAEANMGIAHGDVDGDTLPDVLITHFLDEHDTLWRARLGPDGSLFFQDSTKEASLGLASRPFTGWGCAFADFDQDSDLDLIVVNGHIRPESKRQHPYTNPPLLWNNDGRGRFRDVTSDGGSFFTQAHLARGLACGDLDNDGDLDVVVVRHKAPAVVLRNETRGQGHWLLVDLRGAAGNRDPIGAGVRVEVAGRALVRTLGGGGSYLSSHDRRLHFGLGTAGKVDLVEVRWPSGRTETRRDVPADTVLILEEPGRGSVAR